TVTVVVVAGPAPSALRNRTVTDTGTSAPTFVAGAGWSRRTRSPGVTGCGGPPPATIASTGSVPGPSAAGTGTCSTTVPATAGPVAGRPVAGTKAASTTGAGSPGRSGGSAVTSPSELHRPNSSA